MFVVNSKIRCSFRTNKADIACKDEDMITNARRTDAYG